ncbi:hypothetical protein [Streptomyces chengmaiensis]|uniref:hypothetical protein n=1 Tax=Streptomyces chengmaiensis TaxID=3040919 RepID=UPI0037D9C885
MSELQRDAVRFSLAADRRRFRLGGAHGPLPGALVDRLAAAHLGTPVTTQTS